MARDRQTGRGRKERLDGWIYRGGGTEKMEEMGGKREMAGGRRKREVEKERLIHPQQHF